MKRNAQESDETLRALREDYNAAMDGKVKAENQRDMLDWKLKRAAENVQVCVRVCVRASIPTSPSVVFLLRKPHV